MEININTLTEDEHYRNIQEEVLDEGIFSAIVKGAASLLGYTSLTIFAGLGAAMIAKSAISKEGKIRRFFKRIFGKDKEMDFDYYKNKPAARRELAKSESVKNKLPDVYKAIEQRDWDKAETLFKKSQYSDDEDVIKAVALKITDEIGEPPLYIYPQGNQTYFICKKILGIKYAKALASAVLAALKQNKSYYGDIKVSMEKENSSNINEESIFMPDYFKRNPIATLERMEWKVSEKYKEQLIVSLASYSKEAGKKKTYEILKKLADKNEWLKQLLNKKATLKEETEKDKKRKNPVEFKEYSLTQTNVSKFKKALAILCMIWEIQGMAPALPNDVKVTFKNGSSYESIE